MPTLEQLPTHVEYALTKAANNLATEFAGTFSVETIEQFLATSYDQFATGARITTFLPLMAERFARQRLHAHGPELPAPLAHPVSPPHLRRRAAG